MGNTCNRSICITREVDQHIKENLGINSFSSWVDEKYRETFLSIEAKERIREKHKRELKKLDMEIKLLKKFERIRKQKMARFKKTNPFSMKEIDFFKNFGDKLGDQEFVKGQMNAYMNLFNVRLTDIQFLTRIEQFQQMGDGKK